MAPYFSALQPQPDRPFGRGRIHHPAALHDFQLPCATTWTNRSKSRWRKEAPHSCGAGECLVFEKREALPKAFHSHPRQECHGSLFVSRSRIAPLAVDGSTTRPPCTISSFPASTSRRAARRVSSMRSRQSSGNCCRAASLGQIVASDARWASRERMVSSSARSIEVGFRSRQASEQYFTSSQQRSHFFRHSMRRPQVAQFFSSGMPTDFRRGDRTRKQAKHSAEHPQAIQKILPHRRIRAEAD